MDASNPLRLRSFYIVGGDGAVETICIRAGMLPVKSLMDADVVIYTGGADVSPRLYNEPLHPTTRPNPARDRWEIACFNKARKEGKMQVGICRGGQLLNVLNGGQMWQHVDHHAISGTHPMEYISFDLMGTKMERTVFVTSTHHQMMIPRTRPDKHYGLAAEVWGRAGMSTRKEGGKKRKDGSPCRFEPALPHQTDTEILWYRDTQSLCFQPHPEYNHKETRDLFFECLGRALRK